MSDDTGIHSEAPEQLVTQAAPSSGIRGFLSTTVGKVVVGCLAAGILLAIVSVVVVIALGAFGMNLLGQATNQAVTTSGTSGGKVTTGTASPSGGATGTAAPVASAAATPAILTVTDEDVFTPRDPFIPVVLPAPPAAAASTSGGSTGGSITSPSSNTLYLINIVSSNGGSLAQLDYKGVVYKLAAGESIPNSPWKVLSINAAARTVTMLFGDERVTVALGEGVQSK